MSFANFLILPVNLYCGVDIVIDAAGRNFCAFALCYTACFTITLMFWIPIDEFFMKPLQLSVNVRKINRVFLYYTISWFGLILHIIA